MRKVVVTGAAGFIGSFLSERLLKEGYRVVGLDNYFRGDRGNVDQISRAYPRAFDFFEADITREIPPEIFRGASAVFHYAAINGTRHFYERPLDVLRVNVQGTVNVLDAAVRSGSVEKICFASSSEVYGEPSVIPTPESEPCVIPDVGNPRHSYSLSKMMGESYLLWFAKKYGISYLIFRIFNTYGPRMDSSSYGQVIPEFVRKLFFDREFTIIGDGSQRRSFCYVSDNVEFALRAFEKVDDETLNVGDSREVSVLELAELMHGIIGRAFSYKCLEGRRGDIKRRSPDVSKIKSLTGFAPQVSLEDGLRMTLECYAEKWNLPKMVEEVAK
jgi:nucleoside-diphosphate-sugar epimerase